MKILFWNVWCLPALFTDGKTSPEDRAKLISPHLAGYDVVLLCEAWTKGAKNVFLKTYPYQYTDNSAGLISFGTGLMVLSKYPIVAPSMELYKMSADFDWFSNKGIFSFQINFPTPTSTRPLIFFLTHMQATYNNSWPIFVYTPASKTAILYQTVQLSNFVNTKLENNKSTDVWLIGDFNMWKRWDPPRHPENTYDDNIMRMGCYNILASQINMKDLQTRDDDVYRFFTRSDANTTITYEDSHGLSDGPYVVLDVTI